MEKLWQCVCRKFGDNILDITSAGYDTCSRRDRLVLLFFTFVLGLHFQGLFERRGVYLTVSKSLHRIFARSLPSDEALTDGRSDYIAEAVIVVPKTIYCDDSVQLPSGRFEAFWKSIQGNVIFQRSTARQVRNMFIYRLREAYYPTIHLHTGNSDVQVNIPGVYPLSSELHRSHGWRNSQTGPGLIQIRSHVEHRALAAYHLGSHKTHLLLHNRDLCASIIRQFSGSCNQLVGFGSVLHGRKLILHHFQLSAVDEKGRKSDHSQYRVYDQRQSLEPPKLPREFVGGTFVAAAILFGICGNFAWGYSGLRWRWKRRAVIGAICWMIAIFLVVHGANLIIAQASPSVPKPGLVYNPDREDLGTSKSIAGNSPPIENHQRVFPQRNRRHVLLLESSEKRGLVQIGSSDRRVGDASGDPRGNGSSPLTEIRFGFRDVQPRNSSSSNSPRLAAVREFFSGRGAQLLTSLPPVNLLFKRSDFPLRDL